MRLWPLLPAFALFTSCIGVGDVQILCVERSVRGETMLDPEFVLIPPGRFLMGSSDPEALAWPQMDVTLTRPFWMQTSEVTMSEWWRVVKTYADAYGLPYADGTMPGWHGPWPSDAVEAQVGSDWYAATRVYAHAIHYANARSIMEGYEPCYDWTLCVPPADYPPEPYPGQHSSYTNACAIVAAHHVDPDCNGYRLPTEAEWEWAARAGSTTEYPCGNDASCMYTQRVSMGRCDPAAPPRDWDGTWEVGSCCANAFGLFDMHDNVREYTGDFRAYGLSGSWYVDSPLVDPFLGHLDTQMDLVEDVIDFIDVVERPGSAPLGAVAMIKGASPDDEHYESWQVTTQHPEWSYLVGFRVVRTAFERIE